MIRTQRNPSKRNILLNIMPVSTDPGLSPSTSHLMSPISHRSSWSSTSEFEQPPSCNSARQGGKINQLIKANEAIAVELSDLESGKERWLEKLKLLEARICSNLVNIDKWAAENKSKLVSIEAVDDGGDIKVGESALYGSPSTWRLSLADLVSIFKGSKLEQGENAHHSPRHPSEAYGVVSGGGRNYSPMGVNSVVGVRNSSWNEQDSISVEADHAVESTSSPGNIVFTRAMSPNEISPSRGAAYSPHKRERQHSRGSIAVNGKNFHPTNPEQGPASRFGSTVVEKEKSELIGDEMELSRNEGADECSQCAPQRDFMLGKEEQSFAVSSQTRPHDALSEAREEIQQLKQQPGLGQVELHDALGQARQELQQLEEHALTLEKEKSKLETTLSDCKQALQDAKLDAATLQMQKEQLQTKLADLERSSESVRLALLKEKDDQGNKLLSSVKSLEEAQQSAIVLERQKLVLQSELNYCREILEKTQLEVKNLKKEKAALEQEFAGCKQTLKEAQQGAVLLEKERDDFAAESNEYKTNLEKNQQHCLMLEKGRDELRRDLAESKHTLEEVLQKSSIVEREKRDLEAAHETLMNDLEKSEQHALMLENENAVLENVLTEFKHTLEEIQQQMIVLEGQKDDLESELSVSKQAYKEAWRHALSLEEEKNALEIGSGEYKDVLEETEQHVLTLQSALEGTLQRADALDHQVQWLRSETKRLCENNESLKALKNEQETKCRDLERQREGLQAEMEIIKSEKEAAEKSVVKINDLYALAMEETKKEREALQQEQSLLKKESASLKLLLDGATQRSTKLEADRKEMQERLKDGQHSLQKAMQELNALNVEHGNEVAALKIENVANESRIQKLMEQLQEKCTELERLCKVENEVDHLSKRLKDRELQLESTTGELESMKAEMAGKFITLERERSAKEAILQELSAKDNKLKELEKDLSMIRAEQTGLRGAMKDEMVRKKELMQKIHDERGRSKDLEVALELAKLEQNNLLMDLENERMAKEAALEESEAIKSHSEELEKDLGKLQAEVCVMWEEENEEQADALQALREEQARSRELEEAMELRNAEQEDAQVAMEDERDANEALMRELEQEQRQRMQLEEQFKVLRAEEEHIGAVLQEERAAMERLKKQLDAQEARCRELENALNGARIEQDALQLVLEEEVMSKGAVMQELEEQRNRCLELEQIEVMKDKNNFNAYPKSLSLEVTELLAKSKELEKLLSTLQREGADDGARSAATQEVKKLQSRIQHIESRLAEAGYVIGEGKEKNEDELHALLPMFEQRVANLEAHDAEQGDSSMNTARQTEEELRRLKESTQTLHQALSDAHHMAISDLAGLLVELGSLKRLLNDKTMVASDRKEDKRKGSLSLPTAALSTSALAAIGLLAFLKLPKHYIT